MSHHGEGPPPDVAKFFKEKLVSTSNLEDVGAIPKRETYPDGKLSPDDKGKVLIQVRADPARRRVVMEFDDTLRWIGFTPEQALDVADFLVTEARKTMGQ